jgi:hypothetical protein
VPEAHHGSIPSTRQAMLEHRFRNLVARQSAEYLDHHCVILSFESRTQRPSDGCAVSDGIDLGCRACDVASQP